MRLSTLVATFAIVALVSACGGTPQTPHSAAPEAHRKAATQVYIGMPISEFTMVMAETNAQTRPEAVRTPAAYTSNGVIYEIHYIRSGWVSDNMTTDDEYTPYLFQDATLIGYGWAAVGGKKTDSYDIQRAKAAATKVEVNQNVEVTNEKSGNKFFTPIQQTCIDGPLKQPGCD